MRGRLQTSAGFTLLELSLVLVLTGIVIGGLWVLGANAFYNQSINQLEKGIVTTATRIRNFYRDRQIKNDTSALNNANLSQLDLVAPEISINSTTNAISFSGFGGNPITISIDYGPKANDDCGSVNSFAITLSNVTKDMCNQLVPRLAGTGGQIKSNGIAALFIYDNNVIQNTNGIISFNGPETINACGDGSYGDQIEICFQQF